MYYRSLIIPAIVFFLFCGCSRQDKQVTDNKQDNQTVQPVSGKEVSVEIHTKGMTCTGCESTIKTKVKKIGGVKDVMADYKTNTVKATYDDGKTNVEAIKDAIVSAGYKIESVQ
jgi:copper chaperone